MAGFGVARARSGLTTPLLETKTNSVQIAEGSVLVTTRSRTARRVNWLAMTLLSLAITGYFVGQYMTAHLAELGRAEVGLAQTYAGRPAFVQVAFYVHIISAGLALALGPFQFSAAIRRRRLRLHRWNGRAYMFSVAFGALSGLVLSFYSSVAIVGFFGFGALSVLWGWTTYRGYQAARDRDFASHQAWMIRSFALTFAAVTLRLWLGILIAVQLLAGATDFDLVFDNAYAVLPFLCWLPNIVVAELLIHRRNLPGLRFSPSPAVRVRKEPVAG